MNRRTFLQGVSSLLIFPSYAYASSEGAWPIRNEWNQEEVNKYSQWVENIFDFKRKGTSKQRAARLDTIIEDDKMNLLNNPDFLENGNPKLNENQILRNMTHCGSFPELLFQYYSYRRALPSAVAKITMRRGGDIRYSQGNHPIGNVDSLRNGNSFNGFLINALNGGESYNFVSGNFRTAPNLEGTDSVPIAIDRKFLKPGSLCYNANGHVLVVGKITPEGEVHFIDAHPDKSITANQTLSAIPSIQSSSQEKWYDGFRMMRLVKKEGNHIRFFSNEEMIPFGFSTEQYELMKKINEGKLAVKGQEIKTYPQLVKTRLIQTKESPMNFLENSTNEFAAMLKERESFVQETWRDVLRNGPITFPNESTEGNIYQASGRWETWSSPSSDIDRREKYHYMLVNLEAMLQGFKENEMYNYSGFSSRDELALSLLQRKRTLFDSYVVEYTSSIGEKVNLTLSEIEKRLFDLSFDPNHPPELRWGAPKNSSERKSMKLLPTPLRTGEVLSALDAYKREKGLRYYTIRQTTPTSLDPRKNPSSPPFETIDKVLLKYTQK